MKTTIFNVDKGSKFVACWGYDQTQYSVYEVQEVKGKYVFVTGLNSWSSLSDSKLSEGSVVKPYKFKYWSDLTEEERNDYSSRGFDWSSYQHYYGKENLTSAEEKTIAKANRINGQSWTYIWTFTDGTKLSSEDKYVIEQIKPVKKCLLNTKYNKPSIKIDDVITATLDEDYGRNKKSYEEQNLYTSYNGR